MPMVKNTDKVHSPIQMARFTREPGSRDREKDTVCTSMQTVIHTWGTGKQTEDTDRGNTFTRTKGSNIKVSISAKAFGST